jgi:lysophospholipase L1-like esterase
VAIGVNDSRYEGTNKLEAISLDGFKNQLFILSQKLRNTTKKIMILGLTPVIEIKLSKSEVDLCSWSNDRIELFSDALQAWAEAKGYVFVDIYSLTKNNKEFIDSLDDGLHPGDKGHEIIAEEVFRVLKEQKYV